MAYSLTAGLLDESSRAKIEIVDDNKVKLEDFIDPDGIDQVFKIRRESPPR